MEAFLRAITALSFAVFITGCMSVAYKKGNWAHSGDADWDIDSAVCLQHSENLTEEDLENIVKIKEAAQVSAGIARSTWSTTYDDTMGSSASVVSGLLGVLAGTQTATAEESYKANKFISCLEEKGWKRE